MQVSSTTSTAQSTIDLLNSQTGAQGKQTLNQEDFFKLLTAQLAAQDPLKPMDDMSFISQMASFSSLQQMQSLSKSMTDFTKQQQVTDANGYLGKTVTVTDDKGGDVTGVVSSINIDATSAKLMINGAGYGVDAVTSVKTN